MERILRFNIPSLFSALSRGSKATEGYLHVLVIYENKSQRRMTNLSILRVTCWFEFAMVRCFADALHDARTRK